jgi:hypothetical protein
MSKIAVPIAVLMFAFAASASADTPPGFSSSDFGPAVVAQDFRSPDARAVLATETQPAPAGQDLRSPDGGAFPAGSIPFIQDLGSPDTGPTGAFAPPVPSALATEPGDSFAWGYLAAMIAAALVLLSWLLLTFRRRHHGLAPGH